MKVPVLCWWAGGIAAVAIAVFRSMYPAYLGGSAVGLAGFILFITGMAGAGIHAVMETVVEERCKHTLTFIMSLPITVREYTSAKLMMKVSVLGRSMPKGQIDAKWEIGHVSEDMRLHPS